MKVCRDCGVEKPLDEFTYHPNTKDNRQSYCNPCFNARKRRNEKEWRKRNPKKYKAAKRRATAARYGLTDEHYQEMYADQEGRCEICGQWFEVLAIDHCHGSEKVRGLLCTACNTAIGQFKDSIDTLKSAIHYLQKYSARRPPEK